MVNEGELRIFFQLMGTRIDLMGGTNKKAHCPLAPWTHKKGKDKNASMTVKAGDPVSLFRCWSCNHQGSLRKLAKLYAEHSGDHSAFDFISKIEGGSEGSRWGSVKNNQWGSYYKYLGKSAAKAKPFTEEELLEFKRNGGEYVFSRGFNQQDVGFWEVGTDNQWNKLVIPIRDEKGYLVGASKRDLSGKSAQKYKHTFGFKKEEHWYGEHRKTGTRTASLCEGFFDVWKLYTLGCPNPLASMGTSISENQITKLVKWTDRIIFFPDWDKSGAGIRFAEESCEKLSSIGFDCAMIGVITNSLYNHKPRPKTGWSLENFKVIPMSGLLDKDPSDLTEVALRHLLKKCIVYKKNEVVEGVDVTNWVFN